MYRNNLLRWLDSPTNLALGRVKGLWKDSRGNQLFQHLLLGCGWNACLGRFGPLGCWGVLAKHPFGKHLLRCGLRILCLGSLGGLHSVWVLSKSWLGILESVWWFWWINSAISATSPHGPLTSVAHLYGILAFRHSRFPWGGGTRAFLMLMVPHQGHVVVALVREREKLPFLNDWILARVKLGSNLHDRSCMCAFFSFFFLENIGHLAKFQGFHGLWTTNYELYTMSKAADFGVMMGTTTAQVQQEGGGRPCPGNATEAQRPCVW